MLLLSEHRELRSLHPGRFCGTKESSLPLIRLSSCLSPLRPFPAPSNSHGIISFADPHPLNPVVSYRYKNIGGQGAPPGLQRSNVQPCNVSTCLGHPYLFTSLLHCILTSLSHYLLFSPSRDEKHVTATPSKSTVTNCDARKSFGIRFYQNCRVSTPTTLPFWNSPPRHTNLIRTFSFHALTWNPFCNPFVLIFIHVMGGMYTPLALPAIPSSLSPSPYPLSFHTLPHSFALFCTHAKLNSLVFNRFRTLCTKHPGVGYTAGSRRRMSRAIHLFHQSPITSHQSRFYPNRYLSGRSASNVLLEPAGLPAKLFSGPSSVVSDCVGGCDG